MSQELFAGKYRIPSVRLKNYDYSSNGIYFVTICTRDRENFFGKIQNGRMELNNVGRIVHQYWSEIPNHFGNAELNDFVIMPNHVHGIVIIRNPVETRFIASHQNNTASHQNNTASHQNIQNRGAINRTSTGGATGNKNPMLNPLSLSKMIRWYKGRTTYEIRKSGHIDFSWQSSFYEHIIRSYKDLDKVCGYITDNPVNWDRDRNNFNI